MKRLMHISEVLENAMALYGHKVRGVAVSWPPPGLDEGWSWRAWGPDGLWADWEALGLAPQIEEVARALHNLVGSRLARDYPRGWHVSEASLYLGPQGWILEVMAYDMDHGGWRVREYCYGEPPEAIVSERPPYDQPDRPLSERVGWGELTAAERE